MSMQSKKRQGKDFMCVAKKSAPVKETDHETMNRIGRKLRKMVL